MDVFVTSCDRHDLLNQTLGSLLSGMYSNANWNIHIHEDGDTPLDLDFYDNEYPHCSFSACYTRRIGQHKSIEHYLKGSNSSVYLHLEDDWYFENIYRWVEYSANLMSRDTKIIKVLARDSSPHKCNHNRVYRESNMDLNGPPVENIPYGYLDPWTGLDNITWHGFSWNPGLTRSDLLRKFMPFPKWEQDLAEKIYLAGYKVIELGKPIYKHIGDGRSTHN